MNWQGIDIVCPHCRGELRQAAEEHGDTPGQLVCLGCSQRYPVVCDIPDLRVFLDPYISAGEEYAKARHLVSRYDDFDFAGLVEYYYSISPLVPPHHAKKYARGLLVASARTELWLPGWEEAAARLLPAGQAPSPEAHSSSPAADHCFLDLGCGTAPLLIAAKSYAQRVGVDLALRWLVMARKRLLQAGLQLPLICACAEALPFCDGQFGTVAADSVIEHLRDQSRSLREVHRVSRAGGRFFLATPNRFSVGPDPQTGIWGGSLLPLSWTHAMVRRQGGLPPQRRLLSAGQLRRLLQATGFSTHRIFLPSIPAPYLLRSPFLMRTGMQMYNLLRQVPVARNLLQAVCPLFHAAARKLP